MVFPLQQKVFLQEVQRTQLKLQRFYRNPPIVLLIDELEDAQDNIQQSRLRFDLDGPAQWASTHRCTVTKSTSFFLHVLWNIDMQF